MRVQGKGLTVRARRGYYAPAEGVKAPPARAATGDPDLQKALDQAERLGGKVVQPVTQLEGGPTVAMIDDPEGHRVGLLRQG